VHGDSREFDFRQKFELVSMHGCFKPLRSSGFVGTLYAVGSLRVPRAFRFGGNTAWSSQIPVHLWMSC
jgi:hypothetical protein